MTQNEWSITKIPSQQLLATIADLFLLRNMWSAITKKPHGRILKMSRNFKFPWAERNREQSISLSVVGDIPSTSSVRVTFESSLASRERGINRL